MTDDRPGMASVENVPHYVFITSAKEVMSAAWFVRRITQKLLNRHIGPFSNIFR